MKKLNGKLIIMNDDILQNKHQAHFLLSKRNRLILVLSIISLSMIITFILHLILNCPHNGNPVKNFIYDFKSRDIFLLLLMAFIFPMYNIWPFFMENTETWRLLIKYIHLSILSLFMPILAWVYYFILSIMIMQTNKIKKIYLLLFVLLLLLCSNIGGCVVFLHAEKNNTIWNVR